MDDELVKWEETGERVYHPRTCGGCHGAGCPIVRLISNSAIPLFYPRQSSSERAYPVQKVKLDEGIQSRPH
jgi:hypothetical protein